MKIKVKPNTVYKTNANVKAFFYDENDVLIESFEVYLKRMDDFAKFKTPKKSEWMQVSYIHKK